MSAKKKPAPVESPKAPAAGEKSRRLRGRARAEAVTIEGPASGKPVTLSPGVKLVRVFKGVRHEVVCMGGGKFSWRDKFFGSLSALACEISGSHVSGPAWFGLVKPRSTKPRGKK